MITERTLISLGVVSAIQFGSSVWNPDDANDIDIALIVGRGVDPRTVLRGIRRLRPRESVTLAAQYGVPKFDRSGVSGALQYHWVVITEEEAWSIPLGECVRHGRILMPTSTDQAA